MTMLEPTIENISHLGCKVEHFSGDAGFGNIKTIERLIFLDNLQNQQKILQNKFIMIK